MPEEEKIHFDENERKNQYKHKKYVNGVEVITEEDESIYGDVSSFKQRVKDNESLSKSSSRFQHQNSIGSKFSNASVFKSTVRGEDFFEDNDAHFHSIGVSVSQVPSYFNPEAEFRYEKQTSLRDKEKTNNQSNLEDSRRSIISRSSKNDTIYQSVTDANTRYFENFDGSSRDERGDTQNTFMTASEMEAEVWEGIED